MMTPLESCFHRNRVNGRGDDSLKVQNMSSIGAPEAAVTHAGNAV